MKWAELKVFKVAKLLGNAVFKNKTVFDVFLLFIKSQVRDSIYVEIISVPVRMFM